MRSAWRPRSIPRCAGRNRATLRGRSSIYYTRELALRLAEDARDRGGYHDCHCWVFTYESFLDLVAQANAMGVLDARIAASAAPVFGANEFHVVFSRA